MARSTHRGAHKQDWFTQFVKLYQFWQPAFKTDDSYETKTH